MPQNNKLHLPCFIPARLDIFRQVAYLSCHIRHLLRLHFRIQQEIGGALEGVTTSGGAGDLAALQSG